MSRSLRVGSLFAGIGGFDLAAERAGMTVAWQSEVDPFASRVLAHRFPGVPNLGDVRGLSYGVPSIDVLCGGFPCQDVSVAGLRAGLAGERSGLFWEIVRVALDLRPAWLVLENVPGLLSSNDGRDMGAVLGALGKCGYGYAYRVLDAQHFGVPQRRRRVFIVACAAGDVRRAGQVLFESESGAGDSPPRRAEREDVAYALAASVRGTGDGHGNAWNTTYAIKGAAIGRQPENGPQRGEILSDDTCYTLNATEVHAVGVNLSVASGLTARYGKGTTSDADDTLIWDQAQITSKANRSRVEPGLPSPPCAATGQLMVANTLRASDGHHGFSSPRGDGGDNLVVGQCHGSNVGEMGTLRGSDGLTSGVPFVAFDWQSGGDVRLHISDRHTGPLQASQTPAVSGNGVRRLTPVECERLMGLPDAWTCLADHAQPCSCSDGPRYRALGNAVAVPVAEWILRRIAALKEMPVTPTTLGAETDATRRVNA